MILEHSAFLAVHRMLLLHLARIRPKSFSRHTEDDLVIQVYASRKPNIYFIVRFFF